MANLLERKEEVLKTAEEKHKLLFADSIRLLEKEYTKRERCESIIQAFTNLFCQWNILSEQRAESLGICFLYSSILMQTYEYHLVLYDKEFYLNKSAVEAIIRPPCLYEAFEQDMAALISELKGMYPSFCRCEEDVIRFQCAEYYHAVFYKLCADLLEDIINSFEYKQMNKTEDFFIFFGKYRGEGKILYRDEG